MALCRPISVALTCFAVCLQLRPLPSPCLSSLTFVGFGSSSTAVRTQRLHRALRASPETAVEGWRARIEYTGTLENGTVFATTDGQEPLEFVIGEEGSWVEEAVLGLAVGESRDLLLGADRPIYGTWQQNKVREVPVKTLPKGAETKAGDLLRDADVEYALKVVAVDGENASIDYNHPLVGRACTMSVRLVGLDELAEAERVVIERVSPGDGKSFPKRGDTLSMHYTGSLASNGVVFDDSRGKGEPLKFRIGIGQVIQGWDKGVMKMSIGERAILKIPASLGYGSRGAGRDIPPNADLIFDVELLAIS
mmetsp:Transcript_15726/g.54799  ORF Transcript_15726/g.54799 Transcript_15726/m.54799 type:complete len:308 (+) Transcript_15726:95-1018(+)